jgi:L-alanine-DL-glutamate epimerase-like enolase superfamily enzyme
MKITDVQAHLLSSPMAEPIHMTFYGGERTIYKRDALLIRVMTDGGLTGYGPGPASVECAHLVRERIRSALVGEEAGEPEALRKRVEQASGGSGEVAHAFGGVEIALYDLAGKMQGCPVYELLGGRVRDRIRLYGSAGMYQPPEGYAREAAEIARMGFGAYKMRPALGPEEDVETVARMRAAVGPDVGLMVDAHAWWRMGDRSYSAETIERIAREMARYGIAWLEEPQPPEDRAAYLRLRALGIVPLAAGEHETSWEGFRELIDEHVVDFVQADVPHHGGYRSVHRILTRCAERGRAFAFHNWGTTLEALACAHLGVCFGPETAAWLECPVYANDGRLIMYPYPLADEILKQPLPIAGGEFHIPSGPGLGIDVDEGVIERYPFLPGPWSTFRLTSPPGEFSLGGDHAAKWDEVVR